MASIQKTQKGYRAQIYVNGHRESKTFRTQREAKYWAESRTLQLQQHNTLPESHRHTLTDALIKYAEEVSPDKRGHRWEAIRINLLNHQPHFPGRLKLSELTPDHLANWRDLRAREVKPGSVLREISLLSAILETARIEWQWIQHNPLRDIRKPRQPDHREVIIHPAQVRDMLKAMRYSPRLPIRTVAQATACCFLTALRTGMRAGELAGLTWDRVHPDYCHLPFTKTTPRKVPLTRKALRLIHKMHGYDTLTVFGTNPQSLSANFRKYRDRAGLEGFTFHDARHTAATLLARKLDVLDLCRMFGWNNTKHALTYYNPTASSIAEILNTRR